MFFCSQFRCLLYNKLSQKNIKSWQLSAHISFTGNRRGPSINCPHPHPHFTLMSGGREADSKGVLLFRVKGHHLTRSLDIIHSSPWHNLKVNKTLGVSQRNWLVMDRGTKMQTDGN